MKNIFEVIHKLNIYKLYERFFSKNNIIIVLILFAILTAIAEIKPFTSGEQKFIGHADQANMANLAHNIAKGNGAKIDNVWLLTDGGIPGNNATHFEPYWSIYVGYFISIFFLLFGSTLNSLLLPATIAKVAIAALSAWWTYKLTNKYSAAFVVALFLLIHPIMTSSVNGLSDIYLTFFLLLTGTLFSYAIIKKSIILFFITGILIGISIGIKLSGIFLIIFFLSYWILFPNKKIYITKSILLLIGVMIGLFPLGIHNYKAFGTLISPANNLVSHAANIRWLSGNHNFAFYNPVKVQFTEKEKSDLIIKKPISNMYNWLNSVIHGKLYPSWMLLFIMYSIVVVIFSFTKNQKYFFEELEGVFYVFIITMAICGVSLGALVHTEPRYWNFLVPLLTILTISKMQQLSKLFLLFVTIICIWEGISYYSTLQHRPIPIAYNQVKLQLPKNAIVLTPNPWEFAFHTKRKAIALPYTNDVEIIKQVAHRYSANYIAIVDKDARHPIYSEMQQGNFPKYVKKIYFSEKLMLGKFNF